MTTKYDLSDTTFTIPVRYDSEDRIQNTKTVIDYINHHFDTTIILIEESNERKFSEIYNCEYVFLNSDKSFFHRTKCLNIAAKKAITKFIVNYDADVLFNIIQYINSINLLRKDNYEVILPYCGLSLNCNRNIIEEIYYNNFELDFDKFVINKMSDGSVGGALFWNKESFINFGMENENFMSWGYEDNERMERIKKLKLKYKKIEGSLYHINHIRGFNSTLHKNEFAEKNKEEYYKVKQMSIQELNEYMKEWKWLKT